MRSLLERALSILAAERRRFDLSCELAGWRARLTTELDASVVEFERELLAQEINHEDASAQPTFLRLPLFQRVAWMRVSPLEHRMFQLRDDKGRAAMQALLIVERPRRVPMFGRARVHMMGPATSTEGEDVGLAALRELTLESEDLVSLRLQPYRLSTRELVDFEGRARRVGFGLTEPMGVTRTLLVDLAAPLDELRAWVSRRTRQRLKQRAEANVEVRELRDQRYVAACESLANQAMARTRGGRNHFDFAAAVALSIADPTAARVLGMFFPDRPDELLAFVCGLRHGDVVEYAAGGSSADATLRSMPFSYWLLWELFEWAKEGGATSFDLGGVTDGGAGDSVAGISDFKRHFSDRDVEVGREMVYALRPTRAMALDVWSRIKS